MDLRPIIVDCIVLAGHGLYRGQSEPTPVTIHGFPFCSLNSLHLTFFWKSRLALLYMQATIFLLPAKISLGGSCDSFCVPLAPRPSPNPCEFGVIKNSVFEEQTLEQTAGFTLQSLKCGNKPWHVGSGNRFGYLNEDWSFFGLKRWKMKVDDTHHQALMRWSLWDLAKIVGFCDKRKVYTCKSGRV